ncbi:MAG: phosphoenolpyruvate carboxykinase (ATP) [Anaerolineales bacterium]
MSNIYNIKTPAEGQAASIRGDYGLDNLGFTNLRMAYWNLPMEALYEESIFRGEANISRMGPLVVNTGKHTARAASDKFVVREATTEENIWWGQYNKPFEAEKFDALFARMQGYFQGRDVFVQDCFGGADPGNRLPIRIITELAWHSLFVRNMFIKPQTAEEYRRHVPEFTIICAPGFKASPQIDQTPSETYIVLNFAKKMCIIGNTAYAGEIKKSIFTLLNYLLPLNGVMTMHCSANTGKQGDVALFFGLSGTGKTTLSADPDRGLIGDDEHGWNDTGVFNFEDGCYAKVIELSATAEPQIYACTHRFGTILENVIWDPVSRAIDLDDDSLTENTRASYPLDFIDNAILDKRGGHPRNVIFLTCDASGVMPPLSRLSVEQAMYHFISGYTSKIAGTEIGLRDEPEITFSACFGGPFMVHRPAFYAELLRRKIERFEAKCWLVNTGWVGGPYGVGQRISIKHTRNLLNAILNGALKDVEYYTDPVFGFQVPKTCPGVPEDVLYPARAWQNEDDYWKKYMQLAFRFINNMKKFEEDTPKEVIAGGPKI